MNPEKSELEEILKVAKENNELLKKIRKNQKLTMGFRIAYWTFIIAAAWGILYIFKYPFISIINEFNGLKTTIISISSKIDNLTDVANIKSFINNVKK
ncbi:MAG: hypothetical protein U0469_00615 [Candidatus Paceibacterota bacterium]|jgi:hypothetical protein